MKLRTFSLTLVVVVSLLANPGVGGSRPSMTVERFWQGCLPGLEHPPADGFYRVRYFGRTQAVADVILRLIREGEKTVTFTSPWIYAGDRATTPVVGGYSVVTDFAGQPNLVVRTTSVETKPFNAVTEADSQYEGPAVRPLEAWREVHWRFFSAVLEPLDRAPSQEMPVTVERFEVVCTGPAA